MRTTRTEYSVRDDLKMCRFLISELRKNNSDACFPCGNKIWKLAVKENLFSGRHSEQSLRDHMRRMILPNLKGMSLSKNDKEFLQKCFKTKKLPSTKNVTELKNFLELNVTGSDVDDDQDSVENVCSADDLEQNDYQVIIEEDLSASMIERNIDHLPIEIDREDLPTEIAREDKKEEEIQSDDEPPSLVARVASFTETLFAETQPHDVQISNSLFQNNQNEDFVVEADKNELEPEEDEEVNGNSKFGCGSDINLLVPESVATIPQRMQDSEEKENQKLQEIDERDNFEPVSEMNILAPNSSTPEPILTPDSTTTASPVLLFGETQGFDLNVVPDSEVTGINTSEILENTNSSLDNLETMNIKMFLSANGDEEFDETSLKIALQKFRILSEISKKYKMELKELVDICHKFVNVRDLELFVLMRKNYDDFLAENFQ